MSKTKATVISTYRNLTRLIQNIPSKQEKIQHLQTLRSTYDTNATIQEEDKINACIKEAGEKIAYLRIITPKSSRTGSGTAKAASSDDTTSDTGTKRFIYTKDGVVEVDGNGRGVGTKRDSNGRVISNWDGKNMDPCSVKTHNSQLKRMGFANNLHAKGIF